MKSKQKANTKTTSKSKEQPLEVKQEAKLPEEPTLLTVQPNVPQQPKQKTQEEIHFEEMQKKEKEEQAKLTKQIQEIEAKIQFEEREKQTLLGQKQEELNIKKKSIEQLTQTNQRLQTELENLRLQIGTDDKMNVTDKNEIQERNARFENEKRKRQDPLEQRLKVKQKELQNSLAILDKYKKEKDQLQKELDGKVDLIQINSLHDEIKSYNLQIETLSKEMKYLKQIEKEHSQCLIKDQAIQNEIESMKAKIKELNLENKLQLKSKRDSNSIISIFHSYKEDEMKNAQKLLIRRCIYAVMVFFVVTVVSLVFGLFNSTKDYDEVTLCGLVSNICVFTNAIMVKASLPNAKIIIDAKATDSYDKVTQDKCFDVLSSLHIDVINR